VSADGSTPAKDGAKPADDTKSRQKTWEDWREKIEKQKAAVEQMQKENDDIDRQFKLTTGNYYSSAQQRLFDGAAMAKEDAAYKQQMEQKKKSIEDARQKIEDLQEQARRAGVPSGYRD
jgi:multidrug resistance efflux pump